MFHSRFTIQLFFFSIYTFFARFISLFHAYSHKHFYYGSVCEKKVLLLFRYLKYGFFLLPKFYYETIKHPDGMLQCTAIHALYQHNQIFDIDNTEVSHKY